MFLPRTLVAVGADLDHAPAGDGTHAGRRLLLLNVRVEGLALTVGAAIEQAQRGGVVVQGTDVADKRGRVHNGRMALAQDVVAVGVRHLGELKLLPLEEEELAALLAGLHSSRAVHRS